LGLRDPFVATLEVAEITRVLVCFDHVASFIVHAVIRLYDAAGNVIETQQHAGEFKEW
jgi:hypothetical protein